MERTADVRGASRQLIPAEFIDAGLDGIPNGFKDAMSNCGLSAGRDHCRAGWESSNADHFCVSSQRMENIEANAVVGMLMKNCRVCLHLYCNNPSLRGRSSDSKVFGMQHSHRPRQRALATRRRLPPERLQATTCCMHTLVPWTTGSGDVTASQSILVFMVQNDRQGVGRRHAVGS